MAKRKGRPGKEAAFNPKNQPMNAVWSNSVRECCLRSRKHRWPGKNCVGQWCWRKQTLLLPVLNFQMRNIRATLSPALRWIHVLPAPVSKRLFSYFQSFGFAAYSSGFGIRSEKLPAMHSLREQRWCFRSKPPMWYRNLWVQGCRSSLNHNCTYLCNHCHRLPGGLLAHDGVGWWPQHFVPASCHCVKSGLWSWCFCRGKSYRCISIVPGNENHFLLALGGKLLYILQ